MVVIVVYKPTYNWGGHPAGHMAEIVFFSANNGDFMGFDGIQDT